MAAVKNDYHSQGIGKFVLIMLPQNKTGQGWADITKNSESTLALEKTLKELLGPDIPVGHMAGQGLLKFFWDEKSDPEKINHALNQLQGENPLLSILFQNHTGFAF
jgi:hypothetical protein